MKLLSISYPDLSDKDLSFIQSIRNVNDPLFKSVKPHFTFVFPIEEITENEFSSELIKHTKNFKTFSFSLRQAILHKDEFSDNWFVFLVPDEGNDHLLRLHDTLYSEKLKKHLRSDIDYIPHITVCNSSDRDHCKELVAKLNAEKFYIQGQISSIDIVKFENNMVTTLKRITPGK